MKVKNRRRDEGGSESKEMFYEQSVLFFLLELRTLITETFGQLAD